MVGACHSYNGYGLRGVYTKGIMQSDIHYCKTDAKKVNSSDEVLPLLCFQSDARVWQ